MSHKLFAGTWKGRGQVMKRTGEVVATYQEIFLVQVTRQTPQFTIYRLHQDTQHAVSGKPMHAETGFLKIMSDSLSATLNMSHPFPSGAINEMAYGQMVDQTLTLESNDFQRAKSTAAPDANKKQVTAFKREYKIVDDKLHYDQYLATDNSNGELYHHLHCEMERDTTMDGA